MQIKDYRSDRIVRYQITVHVFLCPCRNNKDKQFEREYLSSKIYALFGPSILRQKCYSLIFMADFFQV